MTIQVIPHMEASVDFTLFSCLWVPTSARFVIMGSRGDGGGALRVMTLDDSGLKTLSTATSGKALRCGTFAASSMEERRLTTGDFGGNLMTWDLERLDAGAVTQIGAHDQLINAIDGSGGLGVGHGAPEVVTASRDGKVKMWDLRATDRAAAVMQPSEHSQTRDAWAVAMGNDHSTEANRMLVAGYDNGDVKMFDLRAMKVHWETELPSGVCSLQFDRKDIEMNKLLATCLSGRMHIWDLRTKHPKEGFACLDHKMSEKATIWDGKFLPQNREVFMTAAGGGSSLTLWQYKYPEKRSTKDGKGVVGRLELLQELELGEQPVSSFAWSPDKTGLGLCTSFDQKVRTVIVTKLNML